MLIKPSVDAPLPINSTTPLSLLSKENTPEDAIVASWWDYGYWITTLSERTTLADNATLNDWQIKKIAYALITNPENSWHILSSDHTENISEYLGDENVVAWGGRTFSDWLFLKLQNDKHSYNIKSKPITFQNF